MTDNLGVARVAPGWQPTHSGPRSGFRWGLQVDQMVFVCWNHLICPSQGAAPPKSIAGFLHFGRRLQRLWLNPGRRCDLILRLGVVAEAEERGGEASTPSDGKAGESRGSGGERVMDSGYRLSPSTDRESGYKQ